MTTFAAFLLGFLIMMGLFAIAAAVAYSQAPKERIPTKFTLHIGQPYQED